MKDAIEKRLLIIPPARGETIIAALPPGDPGPVLRGFAKGMLIALALCAALTFSGCAGFMKSLQSEQSLSYSEGSAPTVTLKAAKVSGALSNDTRKVAIKYHKETDYDGHVCAVTDISMGDSDLTDTKNQESTFSKITDALKNVGLVALGYLSHGAVKP